MTRFAVLEKFKEKYEPVADYATRKNISRQAVYKALKEDRLEGVIIGTTHYVLKGQYVPPR